MAFSQQGPRAICILSANGAVSTVTLRQPSTSGGTVTYEVCNFLVLCLCIYVQIDLKLINNFTLYCPTHLLPISLSYSDSFVLFGECLSISILFIWMLKILCLWKLRLHSSYFELVFYVSRTCK